MTVEQVEDLKMYAGKDDQVFNMLGFCLCTGNEAHNRQLALSDLNNDVQPVLFELTLNNRKGQFFFRMDWDEYSSYREESELMLWDGLPFIVTEVSEEPIASESVKSDTFALTETGKGG